MHGDYHLGQVLIVQKRRDDRRLRGRAVAAGRGAAGQELAAARRRRHAALLRLRGRDGGTRDVASRFADKAALARRRHRRIWRGLAEDAFLKAYEEAARGSPAWVEDADTRARLLRLHLLGKALYEIDYEANNRPDWIETPMRGVLSILDEGSRP